MKQERVLIATSSFDEPEYTSVANILAENGYDVNVFEADSIARGEQSLTIEIDNKSQAKYCLNDKYLQLQTTAAAWFRKPTLMYYEMDDPSVGYGLRQEARNIQSSIWSAVPEDKWLNSPERITRVESKLAQLATASSFGFNIPKTVVSNDWEVVQNSFGNQDVVAKMPVGVLQDRSNALRIMYAKVLSEEDVESLSSTTFPYPAIFQEYVAKSREWRVTVVGDKVFDASVHTSEEAKDDWRAHTEDASAVSFHNEEMSQDIKDRCVEFLGHLGLKFGAFDFIEDYDGKITYLEVNPNGQFGWIEEQLGMPISSAIADELVKIAKSK